MRQEPAPDQQKPAQLDEASIDRLRHYRDVLNQRFNDHTSGKLHLPPEQSLALRSHIAQLTQVIEPGTREMWPGFTAEERAFMEKRSTDRKHAANDLGIAVLGPLAGPAILAKQFDAPPETVGKFLELGANIMALEGMGRGWVTSPNVRVIKPETIPSNAATEPVMKNLVPPTVDVAEAGRSPANNAFHDAKAHPSISDYQAPKHETFAQKLNKPLLNDVKEAKPILDWLIQENATLEFDMASTDLMIQSYSSGKQELKADLRAKNSGGKTIDEYLNDFRNSPDGFAQARRNSFLFTSRILNDICTNIEPDPAKIQHVITQIRSGEYLDARDYASLRYMREFAHHLFVEKSVDDITQMSRAAGFVDSDTLNTIARTAWKNAENNSPYRLTQPTERDLDNPDHPGPELGQ